MPPKFYVELSITQPVAGFVALAKAHGADVKTLLSDPKWKTATVRLSSYNRRDVERSLVTYFAPAIAQMHCGAIKVGV